MDLSLPIRSVIPSARADVLEVLAHAGKPMSGRQVARLVSGPKQWRVNEVLGELVRSGLVLSEEHPPARLYRLNREHVAAAAIEALANMRSTLIERMRDRASQWKPEATAVWLFGSFARGEAEADSDIDVLVIRDDRVAADAPAWNEQISSFAESVQAWSGNRCSILEVSSSEFTGMARRGERLVDELRRDALGLSGDAPRTLLATPGPKVAP
ncbi:MAG: nucleotidyltransferase domain-containing protein [Actinobacteria bacterium]|nr:nucleotidyltransferase domain-containing protein [Actinomycetota bacterium]